MQKIELQKMALHKVRQYNLEPELQDMSRYSITWRSSECSNQVKMKYLTDMSNLIAERAKLF